MVTMNISLSIDEDLAKKIEALANDIPLDSLRAALAAMQKHGDIVLIDKGSHEDEDGELNVGEIISADDLHIRVRFLRATGEWKGQTVVRAPEVARVQFASPYLVALKKYAFATDDSTT